MTGYWIAEFHVQQENESLTRYLRFKNEGQLKDLLKTENAEVLKAYLNQSILWLNNPKIINIRFVKYFHSNENTNEPHFTANGFGPIMY